MGPQPLISRLLTRSASWLRGEDLPSRTGQALAWLAVVVLLALGLASGLVALVIVVAANLAEGLVSLVASGGPPLAVAVAIVFLVRARLRARRSQSEGDEASQPDQSAEPVAIPIERVAAIDTPPVAAGPRSDRKEAPEPEPGPSLQAQPVVERRAPFPRRQQPVTEPAAQWASHEGGQVEAQTTDAEDEAESDTDDGAPGHRANAERRRRRAELDVADLIAEAEHQRRESDGAERSPARG